MIIDIYDGTFQPKGKLNDAVKSCRIKKDLESLKNELTLTYLTSGKYANAIKLGALIQCSKVNETTGVIGSRTDIHAITEIKQTEKQKEVIAEEVCHYLLRHCVITEPQTFAGGSPYNIISNVMSNYSYPNLMNSSGISVSISNRGDFPASVYTVPVDEPKTLLDFLKGSEGSIADVFSAKVVLKSAFTASGIQITIDVMKHSDTISEYILNNREIKDSSITTRLDPTVRSVVPYWKGAVNDADVCVVGYPVTIGSLYLGVATTTLLDCSQSYETQPTYSTMNNKAESYGRSINRNPTYNIKVADGNKYAAPKIGSEQDTLTRNLKADIGDLVSAHLFTGEDITVRVVSSEYDCLEEKYTSITIGEKLDSFSRLLAKDIKR